MAKSIEPLALEQESGSTLENKVIAQNKVCFIINPIGDAASPVRRAADGLMDSVLAPALQEKGFERAPFAALPTVPQ